MSLADIKGRPVIFYGAGFEAQYEVANYRQKGVIPACFCDRDPSKWGKMFLGFECMSLESAIEQYPDFLMVVTPRFPLRFHIIDELLNHNIVSKNQILNYEPYKKMRSCYTLHTLLDVNYSKHMALCCGVVETENSARIPIEGKLEASLKHFIEYRDDILDNLNTSEPVKHFSPCDECPCVKFDYWPLDKRFRKLTYGVGGGCQFNCIYCFSPARHNMIHETWEKEVTLPALTQHLEAMGLLHPDLVIEVGPGEICVAPRREEIFNTLEKYRAVILTNAGIYSERIERLVKLGRIKDFIVSVDAGTAETFKVIKGGINAFSKVRENLKRYCVAGACIDLKYIFMENINDNENDVTGFVELAKELSVHSIMISQDSRAGKVPVSKNMLSAMKCMLSQAKKCGVQTTIMSGYFADEDIATLTSFQ